jgi:short-subunit dehydrogenase
MYRPPQPKEQHIMKSSQRTAINAPNHQVALQESKQRGNGTGWAVITGASSGLGSIFADQLAKRGLSLLLAGRHEARLAAVAQRIRQIAPDVDVELVASDLGTDSGVDALAARLEGRAIDVLVNNAGFGTYGLFSELDAGREHDMVAVNVDALVRLTHAALPGMLARGRGGILNVASTIAFQPGPYQATYGASKAFVLSLSQALWAETRGSGVTVTALCPPATRTGFVDALGTDVSHTAVYRRLAAPEPVVAAGLRALDRGHAVVVPGWRHRVMATVVRLAPGWLSALISGRMLQPTAATLSESR